MVVTGTLLWLEYQAAMQSVSLQVSCRVLVSQRILVSRRALKKQACFCSWMGKGVSKAVENINKVIAPAVIVSQIAFAMEPNCL